MSPSKKPLRKKAGARSRATRASKAAPGPKRSTAAGSRAGSSRASSSRAASSKARASGAGSSKARASRAGASKASDSRAASSKARASRAARANEKPNPPAPPTAAPAPRPAGPPSRPGIRLAGSGSSRLTIKPGPSHGPHPALVPSTKVRPGGIRRLSEVELDEDEVLVDGFDAVLEGQNVRITAVLERTCVYLDRGGDRRLARKEDLMIEADKLPIRRRGIG